MPKDLSDKTFLIFGGSGGIGRELCRLLAARDARLVIAGRNEQSLKEVADEFGASVEHCEAHDAARIKEVIANAQAEEAPLAGIVNAFGTMLLKPAHLTSEEEWAETIAVNLTSAFAITQAAAKAFPKEGGSVVFISTVAARIGIPNHEAIAAAKSGLIGLALSAAATYASKKIRYNVVAPGLTDTPLAAKITGNEASLEASKRMHPLGRIGEAEEVASAIAWFLDPAQNWVTGQVLGVDGGLSTVRAR